MKLKPSYGIGFTFQSGDIQICTSFCKDYSKNKFTFQSGDIQINVNYVDVGEAENTVFTFQSGDIQIGAILTIYNSNQTFTFQSGDIQISKSKSLIVMQFKIYIPIW